jgi:serine/threonine-protein kinase
VFLGLHVRKRIWEDGPKVVELLARLRDPVLAGLGAYGIASLLVRAAVGGADLASPVLDVVLAAIGLAVTALAAIIPRWVRGGDGA